MAQWLREALMVLSSCDGETALGLFLDLSMAIQGSDFGTLQVYRKELRVLEIVRQRGFKPDYLRAFRSVSGSSPCSCGRALMTRKPIVVFDAELDPDFAPYWPVAQKAGYRGVHSFPVIAEGQLVGVISTHFRVPRLPVPTKMLLATSFVQQSAEILARHVPFFAPS